MSCALQHIPPLSESFSAAELFRYQRLKVILPFRRTWDEYHKQFPAPENVQSEMDLNGLLGFFKYYIQSISIFQTIANHQFILWYVHPWIDSKAPVQDVNGVFLRQMFTLALPNINISDDFFRTVLNFIPSLSGVVHLPSTLPCYHCNHKFASKFNLQRHQRICPFPIQLPCFLCQASFSNQIEFVNHLQECFSTHALLLDGWKQICSAIHPVRFPAQPLDFDQMENTVGPHLTTLLLTKGPSVLAKLVYECFLYNKLVVVQSSCSSSFAFKYIHKDQLVMDPNGCLFEQQMSRCLSQLVFQKFQPAFKTFFSITDEPSALLKAFEEYCDKLTFCGELFVQRLLRLLPHSYA
jgi:hypothetical protein